MFVDRVEVTVRAGDGGDGALSFRHEKFRARGGPDGGDGGDGGDVILRASRNQNTLVDFRYKKLLQAKSGQPGGKRKRHGKNGEDLVVDVPVGTLVSDKNGEALADLAEDGQSAVIAMGGKGGFGNAHFTSSTRQAPRIAEKGEKGDDLEAVFELKMIADVGIIGLPNAGKSTLLSVVSNAKPEIADYPFTTLHPNLGVVDIDKKNSLLLADIPGLIEGASQGKGLGDEFLRHVERTNILLHLVDAYNSDIQAPYKTIMRELADYKVDLSGRPQVVALTKIEGFDKKRLATEIKELKKLAPKNTPVLAFSSSSLEGLDELLRTLQKQVELARRQQAKENQKAEGLPVIGLREADAWHAEKVKSGFIITGRKIERFAQRTRFGDGPSEERLRDIMRKMGIIRELERQGIEAGQIIAIGQPPIGELEY
ncbi:MAG TPA: GTPase ObgE [Candidatus Saccharimonadales bacterium]|nr:GTPase ObgE [Candidatus Saccharimonadales bacterium]